MTAREGTRRLEAAPRPPVIHTEQLFGAAREVIIKHGEEEYRLRITRADKLILTK
jgi:hemin uptake protein HemP